MRDINPPSSFSDLLCTCTRTLLKNSMSSSDRCWFPFAYSGSSPPPWWSIAILTYLEVFGVGDSYRRVKRESPLTPRES